AESWLSDCCQNDESCSTASDARLPTRILDLGPPNSSQDLCVLVTGEAYERYATLSHCWGTSRPLELKSQNFEDFQKRIAFDTLPKTFQDAVTATRSLRLRYLWIDSLCIIQDSRSDWEDQCAKMAQIYAGSFVTLAGPAASGCQSGFLSLRPIPYHLQLEVSDGENYDNIILAYNSTRRLLGRFKPEPNSPLAERAWVLQERLLSRRILYFGSTRMYFECFTKTRFEDCHYPKVWDPISAGMVRKLRIAHIGSFPECFAYWEELITTYSRMKLTHATDRLPALSGLASDFQGVIGARYLAGVWENDIVRELAWRILSNEMVKPPAILSSDYIAPSWSWAAASRG
ncbi:HET-domain-containing protein, partial [Viridothelium virens]